MCRDNNHGGRRCPHDTSVARRIRRHRAAMVTAHADISYGAPAGLIVTPSPARPATRPVKPVIAASVAQVKALREDVQSLERAYRAIMDDPFSVSHREPYELDGTRYSDSVQALAAIDNVMERKIIAAGDMVATLALRESSHAENAVSTYLQHRLLTIDGELDALTRADLTPEEREHLQGVEAALDTATRKLNEYEARPKPVVSDDVPDIATALLMAVDDENSGYALRHSVEDLTAQRHSLLYTHPDRAVALKAEMQQLLNFDDDQPAEIKTILREHAAAYGKVLQQTRAFGNLRQDVHDTSDPTAQRTLQNALQHYPTEWIAQSNAASTLIVVQKPGGRAYYAHENTIITKPETLAGERNVSELAITDDEPGFAEPGVSVALHEYAHRMEDTGPRLIARMENHYLLRRATHNGVLEQQQRIMPNLEEYAYVDNFPSAYMGRVYPRRRNREIFSMGMETLFAGTKGGFVGVGGSRPDPETKRFILGLLATA